MLLLLWLALPWVPACRVSPPMYADRTSRACEQTSCQVLPRLDMQAERLQCLMHLPLLPALLKASAQATKGSSKSCWAA